MDFNFPHENVQPLWRNFVRPGVMFLSSRFREPTFYEIEMTCGDQTRVFGLYIHAGVDSANLSWFSCRTRAIAHGMNDQRQKLSSEIFLVITGNRLLQVTNKEKYKGNFHFSHLVASIGLICFFGGSTNDSGSFTPLLL